MPSFTSSRPSPPTRSTRSSPSSTCSPAISSKQQLEKPLIELFSSLLSWRGTPIGCGWLSKTAMDWENDLENWLSPFLDRLQNGAQRRWMPLYVQGLLGPGERKSVEAMAERIAPGSARPLQNFLSAAPWSCSPLEELLAEEANRLVGGPDAVLVIDDTPLLKKGETRWASRTSIAASWARRPITRSWFRQH